MISILGAAVQGCARTAHVHTGLNMTAYSRFEATGAVPKERAFLVKGDMYITRKPQCTPGFPTSGARRRARLRVYEAPRFEHRSLARGDWRRVLPADPRGGQVGAGFARLRSARGDCVTRQLKRGDLPRGAKSTLIAVSVITRDVKTPTPTNKIREQRLAALGGDSQCDDQCRAVGRRLVG